MTVETIIAAYGYPAVVAGTFLEGETVLVLAGFAAHRGYLHLPWVILAAFAGSLLGDQLAFYLGRRHGARYLEKRPHWRARVQRAHALTKRYRDLVILGFRFLYGLRNFIPFALGMSPIPAARFLVLNITGAAFWAAAVGTGGYFFGHVMETFLGDIRRYELALMGVVIAVGAVTWALHLARSRKKHPRL